MMWVLCVTCLLLCVSVHTAHSAIFTQTHTEGGEASLICQHNGGVIWSKGVDGQRLDILTARHEEGTKKLKPDPDDRYSVLPDLSLLIKKLSLSDSGIYYCNAVPVVSLTVTPLNDFTAAVSKETTQSTQTTQKTTATRVPPKGDTTPRSTIPKSTEPTRQYQSYSTVQLTVYTSHLNQSSEVPTNRDMTTSTVRRSDSPVVNGKGKRMWTAQSNTAISGVVFTREHESSEINNHQINKKQGNQEIPTEELYCLLPEP